jgi:hypothetical protein
VRKLVAGERSWHTSIGPEIGIRRIAIIKDNDKLQKVGLYLSKYKEKWNKPFRKYEEE